MFRYPEDSSVVLSGQHLAGVDFSGRRLDQFSSEGCLFDACRFDGVTIESASFGAGRSTSEYVGCSFDGARLRMGPAGYARFVDCRFENVLIEHWFCFEVELVGCSFSGRLNRVVFNGSVPSDRWDDTDRKVNRFERNDFSRAELVDVDFRTGIDLTKQRLPTGDEYTYLADAATAVRRARVAFNAWDDAESKRRARGLLTSMEEEVAAGQLQMLIRLNDFPRASREAIAELVAAALRA